MEIYKFKNPVSGNQMTVETSCSPILAAYLIAGAVRDTDTNLRTAFSSAMHDAQRAGLCKITAR